MKKFILALALLVPALALAQVPLQLHYQGYLGNAAGVPVNTPTSITFKFYATQAAPVALWAETHDTVPVANGNFSVLLGSQEPLDLTVFDGARWLGVQAAGDVEMTPRQQLASAPFAALAQRANTLSSSATVQGSQITGTISNVTISGATIVNPQLGDPGGVCDGSRAGALRWVAASTSFEGCNGSAWVSLEQGSLWATRHVEPSLSVGNYNALARGADGLAVIAYRDSANQDLKLARCLDARCFERTVAIVDSDGNVGEHVSIAMDGVNPVIAYYDATNGNLKVAKCANAGCSSSTISTVDGAAPAADVGWYTSIKVPPGGTPVISYYDVTNTALKVAKCGDSACTPGGGYTITTVDSVGNAGAFSSLAIGTGGLPVIAYTDIFDLKAAACTDAACTSAVINSVDSGAGFFGSYASIAIGGDGLPAIAYQGNEALRVAKCADAGCGAAATINILDAAVRDASITIGAGGLPVIAYQDPVKRILKVAKCANADCSGASTIMVVDATSDTGYSTSVAIGGDGRSMVSYYDTDSRKLMLAKCMSAQAPCQ